MNLKNLLRPKRILLVLLAILLPFVLYAGGRLILLKPRVDRNWIPHHSIAAAVRIDGNLVHIGNVRNYRYRTADDFDAGYEDRTYDLDRIESAWFVLSPFRDNWRGPAHSFVSFGFADSQYVAISVEARKEVGEGYSVLKGMANTYELLYVIGDERDLIGLRAVHWNDDVFVYPLDATVDRIRSFFLAMVNRARKLQEAPEFYNTAWNNCTSNLYDHAKELNPGKWSYSWKLALPGYADELLLDMDMIDTDLPLEQARERFRVNEQAARHLADPNFSVLIRQQYP